LEVNVQQINFKILWLLLEILILFLVEKRNPPTRSKTAKIDQKIQGILGVKIFNAFYIIKRFKMGWK
jgi:hypothetical protein